MFCNVSRKSCPIWYDVEKYRGSSRPPMTIMRMPLARWLPKARDTHSEYEICFACPRLHWVRECAALLRCVYYITAFVNTKQMSLSASLVLIERKCVYQQLPYTQIAVLQSDRNKNYEDTHLLRSLFSCPDEFKRAVINILFYFLVNAGLRKLVWRSCRCLILCRRIRKKLEKNRKATEIIEEHVCQL